jgi:DNA-directed RNA polymerase specialized sigma24 family protein
MLGEIHGYVARRLGASLAEDVASETFLIAFDRRRRYDVACPSARPWLYGIASNLVARHRRAEVRRYRALSRTDAAHAVDSHAEHVAGRLDARALRGRLAAALVEVAVKTTRIDPLKASNSTGEVRKGSTVIAERLATPIVDKPGQTR